VLVAKLSIAVDHAVLVAETAAHSYIQAVVDTAHSQIAVNTDSYLAWLSASAAASAAAVDTLVDIQEEGIVAADAAAAAAGF
jgi:hypothetical protein